MAESDSKYTTKTPSHVLSRGVKKHVFTCYMVPPRAIEIMTYFVKHPVFASRSPNRTKLSGVVAA